MAKKIIKRYDETKQKWQLKGIGVERWYDTEAEADADYINVFRIHLSYVIALYD